MKVKVRLSSMAGSSQLDIIEESDAEDTQDEHIVAPDTQESVPTATKSVISQKMSAQISRRGVKRKVETETASGTLMAYLLEEEKNKKNPQETDDLDYFFDNLKCTARKFSDKNTAKRKLFLLVSEMEERHVQQTSRNWTLTIPRPQQQMNGTDPSYTTPQVQVPITCVQHIPPLQVPHSSFSVPPSYVSLGTSPNCMTSTQNQYVITPLELPKIFDQHMYTFSSCFIWIFFWATI